MAYEGMSKLARVLQRRIAEERNAHSSLVLDFGVIGSDYSLRTNTYPIAIPKSDYLVLRQLTLGNTGSVLTQTQTAGKPGDGTHSHGSSGIHGGHEDGDGSHTHNNEAPHVHDVLIPEKMRWLKPGDRVLVAWVQHDAVVLDIIKPATDIGWEARYGKRNAIPRL